MDHVPVIDVEKCDGCGLCVSVCSCGALIIVNNVVTVIQKIDCHWCGQCEAVCLTGAISCPFEIVIEE
ncbi:4Fe-4S binding protein [Chloroflexota bacterium]